VPDTQSGLFQLATGLPAGTWDPGAFDYRDLEAKYIPSYTGYRHDEAGVPWLYSAEEQIMISYDDPESMRIKAGYVKAGGSGGVVCWELSKDTDAHALLNALYEQLQPD
jgi:chitinase